MCANEPASYDFVAVFAGIRIRANRPLGQLPKSGAFDLDLRLTFTRPGSRALQPAPNAIQLPGEGQSQGWLSHDGQEAVIVGVSDDELEAGVAARSVLPYASTLQGSVVLHASAVQFAGGIHAFIAASGTGKSTLATQLATLGLPSVADDLTPCRLHGDRVAILLPDSPSLRPGRSALLGAHFLTRHKSVDNARLTRLTPTRCMELLLWHGFGDLEARQAWATQFRTYECIARTVPCFDLTIPDDRDQIPATATEVQRLIESLGEPQER